MESASLSPRGVLPPVSPRRRRTDRAVRALLWLATVVAVVPLVLVIFYILEKGLGALSVEFFTTDPTGDFLGAKGGVKSAILGTIEIVGFATLLAVPLGVGVALYLTEYGGEGRLAQAVRFFVDVMTGVPSIVFGLFIYLTLVLAGTGGSSFAGWKGSAALALLMLPVVTRSAEVVLNLVPDSLREAALALGAPRWKVIVRVVLPSAASGIVTGALLAVARAAGETAPLLFTATIVKATTFDLNEPMNSLPAQIFQDLKQPNDELVQRAWGAAVTLVAMILIVTLIAKLIQRRSRAMGVR
jgi:phosphate transport system permease protein